MDEVTCPIPGWNPNQSDHTVWELLVAEEENETLYKLPTFILLCVLMLVGAPGNILVLLVYGFRFPASTTKSFIMAMAVFDLINCIMGMPFEMVDLRYDIDFNIPAACKIIRFWITLSTCGSVTVLVAVSIDRFRRICRAFHVQMSVTQSKIVIGALTIVSVAFALPAFFFYGLHTEIRQSLTVRDCSIDDNYKTGMLNDFYIYVLAGMWTISVVVLIILYSKIIYNIRIQKKRRGKLSNQSFDSVAFTRLKLQQNQVRSSEDRNGMNRSSNEKSSFDNSKQNSSNADRPTSDEEQLSVAFAKDDDFKQCDGNKLINRLFSRDANPILEEDRNEEFDDNNFYDFDDESVSLPGLSSNARLINYAKTSLNNYLAASQDTSFTKRSISIIQPETAEVIASVDSPQRNRKYGHSYGRYRSWVSEKVIDKDNIICSTLERGFRSDSYPCLSTAGGHDCCTKIKRSSSLHSLKCDVKEPTSGYTHKTDNPHGKKLFNRNYDNEKSHDELEFGQDTEKGDNYSSPISLNSTSNQSQIYTPTIQSNVNSKQNFNSQKEVANARGSADLPIPKRKRFKSASIITTLTQSKKKKSSAREIRTSKVSLMMLMVTVGFILSYLPHLCIQLFKSLYRDLVDTLLCENHIYFMVHHFLTRSFFINNAINPIIYSFYNKTFRHRCLRLLRSPQSLLHSSEHRISNVHSISQDNDTS